MEEIEEKLREKMDDPKGSFPSMLVLPSLDKKYYLPFEYRKKRNGAYQKKTETLKLAFNFNPFTGEKLN